MGLETGVTRPSDLDPTWPLDADDAKKGDDHLRAVKTAVQWLTAFTSIQTFTTSGTWTRPTGIKKVLIACLGGGSGGGGGVTSGFSGGGGSSGGWAMKLLDVSAIASATVTIGAGGVAGAVGGGLAGDGGDTSFVATTTRCQGRRGNAGTGTPQTGGVADPRGNAVGDIIFPGVDGNTGLNVPTNGASGGNGGNGSRGGGTAQNAQANSGGGGGGGGASPAGQGAGGTGGSGYCIVFEFGN